MTVLGALADLHERLSSNAMVPTFGYSSENIAFAIVLSPDGTVIDSRDLRDTSGKRPTPRTYEVPRPAKRTAQIAPNFLWDKTAYSLGLKRDKKSGQRVPAEQEHAAFKRFHRQLLATSDDQGLRAVLRFLESWSAVQFDSLRYSDNMMDSNVAFQLDGDISFIHQRDSARRIWLSHLEANQGLTAFCLVSGEFAPIARLHPSLKGVRGAQSSGASLVSFNEDAFTSFGKNQGANAPVSERVAFAYATSLNHLLKRDSRQRIDIGDTTTVFWADAAVGKEQAAKAEDLFSVLADPSQVSEEEDTAKLHDKLSAIAEGRPLAEVDPGLSEDTRFYVLGLAPNAARVSIRFWHQDTIGGFARRIAEHWRDLRLKPSPWSTQPVAWQLLLETAVRGKAKNIPPTLGGALMRAILDGRRYPQTLLASIVGRMRSDKIISGKRVAICKACLARDYRLGIGREDVPVSLDINEVNPAYRLGRLFALYEDVQRAALGKVNATIKDRYFGAAAATPALIFPLLERRSANHLARIRNGSKGGLAIWFDQQIDEILSGIGTAFPRSLRLEDQGRFAIGYHHQRKHRQARDRDAETAASHETTTNSEHPKNGESP